MRPFLPAYRTSKNKPPSNAIAAPTRSVRLVNRPLAERSRTSEPPRGTVATTKSALLAEVLVNDAKLLRCSLPLLVVCFTNKKSYCCFCLEAFEGGAVMKKRNGMKDPSNVEMHFIAEV